MLGIQTDFILLGFVNQVINMFLLRAYYVKQCYFLIRITHLHDNNKVYLRWLSSSQAILFYNIKTRSHLEIANINADLFLLLFAV